MASITELGAVPRVAKDLASLQQSADLSLAAAIQESDVRYTRALIIGPADTPYEYGFFEFDLKFPDDYPISCPRVKCITTDEFRTRINPNIYSNGKVCLSILGTWHDEGGEAWSCAQSLESTLMSIQSLMGENPYQNEPGMEDATIHDPKAASYARKVRHETLRIAVIGRMEWMLKISPSLEEGNALSREAINAARAAEAQATASHAAHETTNNDDDDTYTDYLSMGSGSDTTDLDKDLSDRLFADPELGDWDPFYDLIKRRFLWYYDSYMQRIATASTEQEDDTPFELAKFEYRYNKMDGKYRYENLTLRMKRILDKLHSECDTWIKAGLKPDFAGSALASQMSIAFTSAKHQFARPAQQSSRLEVELPDPKNPLHWHLTIFGEPMSNLDGGCFHVQFVVPPDFPESWPRARMLTPIHHRNVNSIGTICTFPAKPDDIKSHLNAVVAALDDKNPKYDPRAVVNPTASAQFWSYDPEQSKVYTSMLRQSVRDGAQSA